MKNRNGLVFALCVMMGAAGTLACSNESGDSGLVIEPESVSLAAYGTQSVKISGATASTAITVTSGNSACVSVNNADNLLADANGMANFLLAAANTDGKKCDTVITVTADGETKVINASVAEATGDAPTGDFKLTLNPTILSISGAGDESSTMITYKQGETPARGRTLKVSKIGGEDGCVEFITSPVTNVNDGTVDFKVKAVKDSCNAILLIEDALTSITGEEVELSVHVGGQTDQKVEGTVRIIDPADKELNIIYSNETAQFTVALTNNSTGDRVANKIIEFTSQNTNCVTVARQAKTDNEGQIIHTVKVAGANCSTTITATALGTTDTLKVNVSSQDKYNRKVRLNYADPTDDKVEHGRWEDVGYVAIALNTLNCEDLKATIKDPQEYKSLPLATDPDGNPYNKELMDGVPPELTTFNVKNISATGDDAIKSVLGYAQMNGSETSPIIAWDCKDIDINDKNDENEPLNVTVLNLTSVLPDIKGRYDLVSNFDLTSGFETTPCTSGLKGICVPKVEVMKAGDWVRFVTDFCTEPLQTLLEFVWSNTILRILDIPALCEKDESGNCKKDANGNNVLSSTYSFLKTLLDNPVTKDAALSAITPSLEEWLGSTGEWYGILKKVAPDVAELTQNMQLHGTIDITEAEGNKITKATQRYTQLEYRWSYSNTNCSSSAYGKEGECRRSINLGKVNSAIVGDWNGTINDASPMNIDIDNHAFNFKWATLLYNAVFGSILPEALDYNDLQSIEDGYYLKALLEKVLFSSFVNYFNELGKQDSDGNDIIIDTTDKNKSCSNFVLALLFIIYEDASKSSTARSIAETVATYACQEGLGKLDELILEPLAKLESSAEVNMSISADTCELHVGDDMKVSSLGEADEPAHSAHDVLTQKETSDRCTWDLDLQKSDGSTWATINGIFHATRID